MENMVLWIVLGAIALFFIILYNRIVSLVQTRKQSFSDIDVQLKLRHELIPNLVETVKGYAEHEKTVLDQVTQARADAMNSASIDSKAQSENALGLALGNLFAVAENYPDLKASDNFAKLQAELADIENKIAAARRFFNNATSEYNAAIAQFPALIIAKMFNFNEETFFEVSASEKEQIEKPVEVKF